MNKRKTKLLTTIGPASCEYDQLRALYRAGANAFRLNFSHGDFEAHQKVIEHTVRLNEAEDANISLVADLQGPKLRLGDLEHPLMLVEGTRVKFCTNEEQCSPPLIPIRYEHLARDVKHGERIMIDDGKIHLRIIDSNETDIVEAEVIYGGELKSRKGFNLPDTKVSVPSLTEKDVHDLSFILSQPVQWVALSFVRHAEDLAQLREIIHTHPDRKHVKIIAKIEKPEALNNLDGIIEAADAVMVARGDLGVEIPFEHVPLLQKKIVNKCIQRAKPVIIATQMMESMLDNARPTRAEVTDVANGVLDGADALMLSGETSVGQFPIKVVETMDKIIRATEKDHTIYHKNLLPDEESPTFLADAICFNACKIAEDVEAVAINGMTFSGYTAFMLSSYRPMADIYIFTANRAILNMMSLIWGVEAHFYDKFISTDESIEDTIDLLVKDGKIKKGDIVINTASTPLTHRGRTNMIKITSVKS